MNRLRAVGALADKSAAQKCGDSGVAHGLEEGCGDLLLNGLDLLAALVVGEDTGGYVEHYGRAFLATAEPEDLTAGLLDPYEEPLDMVLLLPHGGATARRTVRVSPVPERRLPRLELALDRLLVDGRAKVRLLLEELPRRLDVLGVLVVGGFIVGVFIVGVLVVRNDLEDPLVVLGRR